MQETDHRSGPSVCETEVRRTAGLRGLFGRRRSVDAPRAPFYLSASTAVGCGAQARRRGATRGQEKAPHNG
jgi:hypothetical protein